MKRLELIGCLLLSGCTLVRILGSDTASGVLVPGRINIQPVEVNVFAPHDQHLTAHVYGHAHTVDGQPHSLAVDITQNGVSSDLDNTKFFTIQSATPQSFDLTKDYDTDASQTFQVQVLLGSETTNEVVVDDITLIVEE